MTNHGMVCINMNSINVHLPSPHVSQQSQLPFWPIATWLSSSTITLITHRMLSPIILHLICQSKLVLYEKLWKVNEMNERLCIMIFIINYNCIM